MFYTSPIFIRVLPFAIYIFFLALNDKLAEALGSIISQTQWLYAVRVAAVAIPIILFWAQYQELNTKQKSSINSYLLSIVVGVLIFLLWILPYPSWAMTNDTAEFNPTNASGEGLNLLFVMLRLTGAALVVPIMEELFWRSFIMRWLQNQQFLNVKPSSVSAFAFISTAALFAIEHHLWLAGLLAGIAYGWLYRKEGNLWLPIIAHIVTNGLLGLWILQTGNWQYW